MTTFNFREIRKFLKTSRRNRPIKNYLCIFHHKFVQWEKNDKKTFWNLFDKSYCDRESKNMVSSFFGTNERVPDLTLQKYGFPVTESIRGRRVENKEQFLDLFSSILNVKDDSLSPNMQMKAIYDMARKKYTIEFGDILYNSWRNFRIPVGDDYEEVPDFIWPIID